MKAVNCSATLLSPLSALIRAAKLRNYLPASNKNLYITANVLNGDI